MKVKGGLFVGKTEDDAGGVVLEVDVSRAH